MKTKYLKILLISILIAFLLIVSFGFFGLSWQKIFVGTSFYADKSQGMSVSFIDVGKADAIFITCDDYNVLIDSGEDIQAKAVLAYLKRYNVKTIDLAVATHPDNDHIGGMSKIIQEFDVKNFWMPKISEKLLPKTEAYKNMISSLDDKNLKIWFPKDSYKVVLGNMNVNVFSPSKEYDNTNDNSLVLKLDYYGSSFLFMGDAEKDVEQDLIKNHPNSLKANVLKVSHHGSNNASTNEFLQRVSPKYAVVSVGENTNNLPNKECVQRLTDNNIEVFRTDLDGTITINALDNGAIVVHTEK